jgi:hypothetical protein
MGSGHGSRGAARAVLAAGLCLAALVPAAVAQRVTRTLEIDGQLLSISWTPTALRGRTPGRELRTGAVWRMSKDEPPVLESPLALAIGDVVIPPGRTRLSARYRGGALWSLLLFRDADLFEDGIEHEEVPARLSAEAVATEQLALALERRPGESSFEFVLRWGQQAMRVTMQPIVTHQLSGSFGGAPTLFTFHAVPATPEVLRAIRERRVRIGELRQTGGDGLVYAIEATGGDAGFALQLRDLQRRQLEATRRQQQQELERLEALLQRASGERRDRIQARIEALQPGVAAARERLEQRARFPATARIEGTGRDAPPAGELTVELVGTEPLRLRLALGRSCVEFDLGKDLAIGG